MKRRSSFTAVPTAIDRNIDDTLLDYLKKISDNTETLETLAESSIIELTELELAELLNITSAATVVNNLSFSIVAEASGTIPYIVQTGSNVVIHLPAGVDGVDGIDGYTPVKGVDYDDGIDGSDGNDGYTPVKGIDYFDGEVGLTPIISATYEDGKLIIDASNYTNGSQLIDGSILTSEPREV